MTLDPAFASGLEAFDRGLHAWRRRAGEVVDEGVALVAGLEELSSPDGTLFALVRCLAALPVSARHEQAILRLLGRDDPHLQEAGLVLATGAVRARGLPGEGGSLDPARLAGPIERLLRREELDPWVLIAATEWLAEVGGWAELQVGVYAAAVAAADRPSTVSTNERQICRARWVDPRARLDETLSRCLAGLAPSSPLVPVILPRLERRHGTRGLAETQRAAERAARGG